jgi:hypothetical protein
VGNRSATLQQFHTLLGISSTHNRHNVHIFAHNSVQDTKSEIISVATLQQFAMGCVRDLIAACEGSSEREYHFDLRRVREEKASRQDKCVLQPPCRISFE